MCFHFDSLIWHCDSSIQDLSGKPMSHLRSQNLLRSLAGSALKKILEISRLFFSSGLNIRAPILQTGCSFPRCQSKQCLLSQNWCLWFLLCVGQSNIHYSLPFDEWSPLYRPISNPLVSSVLTKCVDKHLSFCGQWYIMRHCSIQLWPRRGVMMLGAKSWGAFGVAVHPKGVQSFEILQHTTPS